jgi:nitrite reductase/ring-hydroxylating ferredoxin subunit
MQLSSAPGAVDVGSVSDFEHAVPRIFVVGDREIGVVRWGDRFFALRNHCPDQGGPLCAGAVRQPLSADLAQNHVDLKLDDSPPVIACPWHHYEFDLDTGQELRGGRRAITYRVQVVEGRVKVRMGPAAG